MADEKPKKTTMLYKVSDVEKPRKQKIAGMNLDYVIIENKEINKHIKEGWKTMAEIKEIYDDLVSGVGEQQPAPPEFDAEGFPWDERINLKDKSMTQKGKWKIKPGTKKEIMDAVRDEIKPKEDENTPTDGEDITPE
jgi:hypothetical protein